jgi:HD-GYP domain-containing protein (c-di-GMP phosphodiesterase class II)
MAIDGYETPDAEGLLATGRRRHSEARQDRRALLTEAIFAAVFLGIAGSLAALSHWTRSLSLAPLVATVAVYLVAVRVRFPVGSAWTAPTQLAFVPMLFMLPTPVVPLIVAGCLTVDLSPEVLAGRLTLTRALARIGDSFYSLGPVLVLVLAGHESFSWDRWPLLVLAFGAQVVFDAAAGLGRTWFSERIAPAQQLPMLWLYLTDACLTCLALAIAASSVARPGLVLLTLPLIGLLWLFAREREQRLDHTLALSIAYRGTALLLGDVVEADDQYTGAHSREVVDLAVAVAEAMRLDATRRRNVEFAALLHDVGKIRIPKEIINKQGELDADEWEIIRRHTIEGETMLKQVGGTLAHVGRFVRASHERFDGFGYPDRLAGEAIPIESRIVAVCDAFNAMTTDRSYRPALPTVEAVNELRRCAGTQFDPDVVEAACSLVAAHTGLASWDEVPDSLTAAGFSR